MRRFLQIKFYSDESMSPVLDIIYYDDMFETYQCSFKLSATAVQDLNVRGVICEVFINGVDDFFNISDSKNNHCYLIKNDRIMNVDVDLVESDILKRIEDLTQVKDCFKSTNIHYNDILENVRIYRRQKNLDVLI